MRRPLLRVLAGLGVGFALLTTSLALGSDLQATDPKTGKPISPVQSRIKKYYYVPETPGTCGKHGTSVDFVATPAEAAKLAREKQKLVMVLHISGHFEDPRFT